MGDTGGCGWALGETDMPGPIGARLGRMLTLVYRGARVQVARLTPSNLCGVSCPRSMKVFLGLSLLTLNPGGGVGHLFKTPSRSAPRARPNPRTRARGLI